MSQDSTNNDSQSMMTMFISISLLFFATQVPAVASIKFIHTLNLVTFYLLATIIKLLKWTNHALDFLCYCISGRRFREELLLMLKGFLCCKENIDDIQSTRQSTVATVSSGVDTNL